MSGSLTALYLQNPQLANALRRQQSGAQLRQMGGDTSPIQHPLQGLARLAQALVGGYEEGQADKEIKGAAEAQQKAIAEALGPSPQFMPQAPQEAPMTAPRAPVAQRALAPAEYGPIIAQASKDTGIPEQLLTGLFAQESGFRPDARNPRSTATGIGQVLDSTAAQPGYGLPPLSPEARLDPAQAIPWSARYLAARAQGLGVNDWQNPQQVERALRAYGENTPEYARAVMQRAGMGGETVPTAAPPQQPQQGADERAFYLQQADDFQRRAAAVAQMNPTVAQILMQRATMAQQMALRTGGGELKVVPDPGSRTGYRYVPSSQAGGMEAPEPRPMVSIQNQGESKYEGERGQTLAKRATEWEDAGTKGAATLTRLNRMEQMVNQFLTGAGAQTSITAGQLAQRLNVPAATLEALGIDPKTIAQGEAIRSLTGQMLVGMIGAGGFPAQAFSNADREMLERSLPSLQNSPEGNKLIIEIMKAGARREIEIGQAWRQWSRANGDSLASVRQFMSEQLPAITERDVVAPLLEGWQETTPAASPAPVAVNPQTGEKLMLRDGQWVPMR